MKLFEKKDQSSDKKLQSVEAVKKAAPKPAAASLPGRRKRMPSRKRISSRRRTPRRKRSRKPGETSIAWVDTARNYLREVVFELKKVVWPSRKETLGSTAVVLVIVGLSAVFLGIVDLVLSRLVKLLVG